MASNPAEFREFVDAVKRATNLVEVVGRDTVLKHAGSVYKGLSPFHAETTPSFVVWPATQTWRDFSGGVPRGGDVFSYVQERDKLSFREALHQMAELASLRPPQFDPTAWQRSLELAAERREMERLFTLAAAYYHKNLPVALRDRYYKDHYGFTDELIDREQLGWADGRLFEYFIASGVPRREALATGLFVLFESGGVADFFVNRLVFPYWRGGRVVYFTARATHLTSHRRWEESKYKKLRIANPKTSYISSTIRNDYFFNEDAAHDAEELVITEGVPDCLSAIQAGVACISSGTTHVRSKDLDRLLQAAQRATRIVICNDAEESGAGEDAAIRLGQELWTRKQEVYIAQIPRPPGIIKRDLNDLVKSEGAAGLRRVLDAALGYPEFLLSKVPALEAGGELEMRLQPVLAALAGRSPLRVDGVLAEISARFDIRRETLLACLERPASPVTTMPTLTGERQIQVNDRQIHDIIHDAWDAVIATNTPPRLFVRAGRLAKLRTSHDGTQLLMMNEAHFYGYMGDVADWLRLTETGFVATMPHDRVIRTMFWEPHPALPPLDSVATSPFFDEQGQLVATPGYHLDARTWMSDSGLMLPPVPASPSADELAAARRLLLDDLLIDFPFSSDADRAHAVGALLLPFVRKMIPEPTPIHLLEAPTPGSGKGLLADLVCMLAQGTSASPTTLTTNEDETRKKITSLLYDDQQIILLDNVKEILDSAQLAAAITSVTWKDRRLGETETLTLPNHAVWLATANNIELSLELARRCVRIRIDAHVDRPWLRSGFRHDPLKPWVREHRNELVHALFVLVHAWLAAGKPAADKTLGSFNAWAQTIGGILQVAGIPGFLEGTSELYDAADSETQEWFALIQAWWIRYRTLRISVLEVLQLATENDLLGHVLEHGRDQQAKKIRLGRALGRLRDRHFGSLRVVNERNSNTKTQQYHLVEETVVEIAAAAAAQLPLKIDVAS